MHRHFLYIFIILFCNGFAQAQVIEEDALNKQFESKNYDAALKGYTALLKKDTNNAVYKYKIGICLLNKRIDRSRAIPFLEEAMRPEKPKYICWYELGKAYAYASRFDDAIAMFRKAIEYKQKGVSEKAHHEIEVCQNAKELMKKPIGVEFYNIGNLVNTEYADYYPIVTAYDERLYFTSRRKGNTGNTSDQDGIITSDIWVSQNVNGVFQKPKNLGIKVNTIGDEQVTGINADGTKMVLYYDYGGKQFGDLQISVNPKKEFEAGKGLSGGVNSPYFETAGCFGNSTSQIYFASDRPGGKGGRDIYVSNELPDGTWSDALPIEVLNTPYNEDFPQISADGKTMYFSSEGFNSMGGFDIFKSTFDTVNNVWTKPVNMGYPLNSPYDEMCFSTTLNEEFGYTSKISEEGAGDFDIYKVYFKDKSNGQQTIIKGRVIAGDTLNRNVRATVYVTHYGDTVGIYTTKRNGKFLLILPVNNYKISIDCKDYKPFEDDLFVYSGEYYRQYDNRDFTLKPLVDPPIKPVETKPTLPPVIEKSKAEQIDKGSQKINKPTKK
jgi:hypothetical protein